MSVAQLRRSLLDERWTVLWYAVGVGGYAVLIAAFWPTMKKNTAMFESLMTQFPEAFVKAFGIDNMTTFGGFLGGELLNFMWPLIVGLFVIMAASAFVAGEIDRGTVELWLSVPAARWKLLASKQTALLAGMAVIVAVTVVSIAVSALLAGETLSSTGLVWCGVVLLSFCVCVAGYTSLLSSLFSSRGAAAGLAAALTLGSYLAGVLSGLSKDVEWLKYVALTSAFHPQPALLDKAAGGEVVALFAIGLACAVASLAVFERRDANP